MESEVRLSQDWPLGRTQCISSFSLLTNIWAEGRNMHKGHQREDTAWKRQPRLIALFPSTALAKVRLCGLKQIVSQQ